MLNKDRNLLKFKLQAFSLLEISIVLLIMGVILSFSLPYLTNHLAFERQKQTLQNFEEITHALAHFVLQNGRLPYPALAPTGTAQSGVEDRTMRDFQRGIVPYKTLGLSPSVAKDGYGHWISYMPHPSLSSDIGLSHTPTSPDSQSFCSVAMDSTFKILDDQDLQLSGEEGMQPAFVLISHGKKGGDFIASGGYRPLTSQHPCKVENTNNDANFKDSLSKECDDSLFWKNRFILMSAYAKTPCPAISNE